MNGKRIDMSYHFKASDKSAEAAVRRAALSQIDAAIADIGDAAMEREAVVHEVRKRCKKLRALIRLVRPGFPAFSHENVAFRDMAKALAGVRDQDVLILTADKVSAHYGAKADRSAIAAIRARLIEDKVTAANGGMLDDRLAAFRQAMTEARGRAEVWTVEGNGFDTFSQGLRDALKRARKAMAEAREDPAPETMHEWRKGVKYHWYHARLLRGIWPGPMEAHVEAAGKLADLLGDHHDLAVLRQALTDRPRHYGDPDAVRQFAQLVAKRERALERTAFKKGVLMLAERPGALAKRWEDYWKYWRKEG